MSEFIRTFPNQEPIPSMLWNNPELGPMAASNGMQALSEVDEGTAIIAPDGSQVLTPSSAQNMLMSLRSQFPFLPIMPLPTAYDSVFLAANAPTDIEIPSGCSLMLIRGSADYYVSTSGRAEIPSANNTNNNAGSARAQSFYAPQGMLWYVGNQKSISVIAPASDTIVTACFWSPDQMPR